MTNVGFVRYFPDAHIVHTPPSFSMAVDVSIKSCPMSANRRLDCTRPKHSHCQGNSPGSGGQRISDRQEEEHLTHSEQGSDSKDIGDIKWRSQPASNAAGTVLKSCCSRRSATAANFRSCNVQVAGRRLE